MHFSNLGIANFLGTVFAKSERALLGQIWIAWLHKRCLIIWKNSLKIWYLGLLNYVNTVHESIIIELGYLGTYSHFDLKLLFSGPSFCNHFHLQGRRFLVPGFFVRNIQTLDLWRHDSRNEIDLPRHRLGSLSCARYLNLKKMLKCLQVGSLLAMYRFCIRVDLVSHSVIVASHQKSFQM